MSIDLQPLTNYENELIRRITYYTSLFIGSLTVIIITVLLDGTQKDFSLWVKIIFSIYIISILVMIIVGNIVWQAVNKNALKYNMYALTLEFYNKELLKESENYYKLLNLKKEWIENNIDTSNLDVLILTLEKNIADLKKNIEDWNNSSDSLPLAGKWYIIVFNCNIFTSAGLLALGIIFIVIAL